MSAITAVRSLQTGCIPPTINLDTPDPECDLDYVPWKTRQVPIRAAMVNGFGFGGQNCVAVFNRWDED
jgi:3-oxoacyl-[acyl-carrier-protein] synthase II